MRGVRRTTIGTGLAAWVAAGLAHAQVAASGAPAIVWYRSSDGCPDGATFLAKLGDKASLARLARGGDRVDFVVTLGATPDGNDGRLERQTEGGTVAIRELHDSSCGNVADALALSLALALDPESQHAEPPSPPPVSHTMASHPVSAARPVPSPTHPSISPLLDVEPSSREPAPRWIGSIGIHGGAVTGVLPGAMTRADAFAELGRDRLGPSLGGGVVLMTGSSHADAGDLRLWIAALRIDGCLVALGSDAVQLSPCVAFDVGAARAAAVEADTGIWAALEGIARLRTRLDGPLSLEVEAGADFPLTRYQITAAGGPPRADVVGLMAAAGVAVELP